MIENKIDPQTLLLCSNFYSIQGEGYSVGVPSYFMRLATCNLHCGFSREEVNKANETGVYPAANSGWHGELHKSGKATWSCDSIAQWLKGENVEFQTVLDNWKSQGLYDRIKNGLIHVIWTGGEPTIMYNQDSIVNFHKYWKSIDPEIDPFYEIETNGSLVMKDEIFGLIKQINCSAKLSNSGMTERQRRNPKALEKIMSHKNYYFKFVVSTEENIQEVFEEFVDFFKIPLQRVYCMPGMDKQADYFERTKFVCEMAMKYGFIAGTRLHVAAWDIVLDR